MKTLKTILKYTGFGLLALIIAAALLPFVFKGKLIAFLKEDINKNLNAVVDFHDANLSFLSSFPDVSISIDSLSVIGIDDFDGIILYQADQTNIDVNLPSLLGENSIPQINEIALTKPNINVVVLDSFKANYLITKDTTTDTSQPETKFKLALKKYSIKNGSLTYQDNTMALFAVLDNINHNGSGDFTQDIFDLDTNTEVEKLSVKYEGTQYLNNVKANVQSIINMNFIENKYTLSDNIIKLNELDLTGQGFVQLSGDDIVTDVSFKTASESFKSLLSMIPNAYTADFKDVQTKGNASFSGRVNGTYSAAKNLMPAFDIQIKIDNGYVKYPSLPKDIKEIFADINIKATRPDYKDMMVNIPKFNLKIGNDPLSGHLIANNLTGDQKAEGHLKGNLDLKNLISAFPVEGVEQLSGSVQCDLDFKAKMSDVNAENYEAISFAGNASAQNIVYKSKDMPLVKINDTKASASPKSINFVGNNMILGKSDLNLEANIINPLAMLSTAKSVQINMIGKSNLFDLNEWMASPTNASTQNKEQAEVPIDEALIKSSSLNLKLDGKKVLMNEYVMDNVSLDANLAANAMAINNFQMSIKDSDMKISGNVANAYEYMFNNGTVDGTVNFTSNKFDANQFMTEPEQSSSTEPMSVIPVPKNVRMKIITDIQNLTYTNLQLSNFKGELEVLNEEVSLRNMTTNVLGGKIAMEGLYGTTNISSPDFSVKLDLSKIKYADAIKSFEMLKKVAPIAEYLDGFFNTTLVMKGKLGGQMTPDLATLDASGFLETLNGTIKGFTPITSLSEKLGIKELKEVNLVNTRNWFEIVQGFIELKEFNKVIKGVDMTISGKHGFGKAMDYDIALVIPRELMKSNKITGAAESGLSLVEKEASKLGLNINQGPNIFLDVKMTGSLKDPKFKITPKTSKGGTVQDAVNDKVNSAVATAKDSINKELKKKEGELRDTITKRANEEIEKAKAKAETAAQKAIDSLKAKAKSEVGNRLDTLTKGVISDSLKQKAKDALGKKGTEEVDKIKDKLKDFNPFKKKGKG